MPATVGYWNIRGRGQSVRLMLEYTGTEYEEKRYGWGPAPDFDPSEWSNEKTKIGLVFPNLPFYIDEEGKFKISQSHAILKHLGRKHGLVGKCEQSKVRVDILEHEAEDMRMAWMRLVYDTKDGFAKKKDAYLSDILKPKLEKLSQYLGNYNWFAGDYITFVDFLLYELIVINRHIFSCCLNNFDNLQRYVARFESLEPIRKYMSSSRFIKTPLNGPMAGYVGN